MRIVPSTRQLALLVVSLRAWDDEADDPLTYDEAVEALADAARSAAAESAYLLRAVGAE